MFCLNSESSVSREKVVLRKCKRIFRTLKHVNNVLLILYYLHMYSVIRANEGFKRFVV